MAVSASAVLLLTSQLLESTSLDLALRLNPLSAEARVKLAIEELTARPVRAKEAFALARQGQVFHRLDARFLSLAGLAAQQDEKPKEAEIYFRSALAISPTELQALSAILRMDLSNGDNALAALRLDILTRRWGAQYETYAGLIPAIVSNAAGFEAVKTMFTVKNARRDLVLYGLLKVDEATGVAADLVAQWAGADVPDRASLVNQVTGQFLKLKKDQEAYLYYLQYGGVENRSKSYVNNENFSVVPDSSPFDWQLSPQRGVNITLDPNSGANVQFLDSPVLLDNLSQLLALVPGKHTLNVEYSTNLLKTPTPVRLEIACRSGQKLGSISLEPNVIETTKTGIFFEIPQNDCALQRLAITSDKLPESWQNRYSGNIIIRSAKVERVE